MNDQQARLRQADELYELYAKPLEREHLGEYVAVSAEGEILLGTDLTDLVLQAKARFGPGNFVFKVGERVVGRWR